MKEEATIREDPTGEVHPPSSVEDDFNPDNPQPPPPARQRRIVDDVDSESTCTYAVAKVWHRRWEEYVGIPKGFVAGGTDPPGAVEMDVNTEANNAYVHEEIWKRLVRWYGIAPTHQLDRKHLYFKDEKVFDVCTLSPFSGIVEHQVNCIIQSLIC